MRPTRRPRGFFRTLGMLSASSLGVVAIGAGATIAAEVTSGDTQDTGTEPTVMPR